MHFMSNWLMNPSALASEYLIVDPKTGEEKQIIVSADDGIRPNSTLMDLAKLKPAFQKDGSTTAYNASQVSDGAAAVLLMKRRVAVQKGLPIIGTFSKVIYLQEQLWVDKYAPKSFTELLSDEQTNREVLLWLKQWDSAVFGSDVVL
ncbi:3-ketoacyl-CoA thiolase 1, peroxisomal [Arachis hypogaea]|nr:3-ketoacyl-CoA thiolase 1, peroxisomal [Arachis hypogaea]